MYNENGILGNQLVVMSREDFDNLVNEAAQTKKNDYSEWLTLPDGDRFISREEASELLRVDFSTLWRWNKSGLLRCKKVGPRRVKYKYSDVLKKLNGEE